MTTMRPLLRLSLVAALAVVLVSGGIGCKSAGNMETGAAGSGGGVGGAVGSGGTGRDAGGAGGTGGNATGTGGMRTPQMIHDGLLNAPTPGGIDVTRTSPTTTYPACQ